MTQYSKILCPKCKTAIEGWHRSYITFGNPFITCPTCGINIRKSHVNEWDAMSVWVRIEYILAFYFQAMLLGGVGVSIIVLIIEKTLTLNFFIINDNPTTSFIIPAICGVVIGFLICHTKFKRAIFESRQRTKNPKYRQLLGINN